MTTIPRALVIVTALVAATVSHASHEPPGTALWAYEAGGANARILQYDIGTDTFVASCVPKPSNNGRDIAFDPLDGNLWYTFVGQPQDFPGDGLIHKASPPPACVPLPAIPFGDGPGGDVQDDVGALDVDPDDGNLWAAGYGPVGSSSFLYKVDRVTGAILQSCSVPFGGGGAGNDTLAVANIAGLGGSGKYLLTDAGEAETDQGGSFGNLLAVDAATCVGGGAGTVVGRFDKVVGMAGIDFDGAKLIATDDGIARQIYDLGAPPFAGVQACMSTSPSGGLEDITLGAAGGLRVTAPSVLSLAPGATPGSLVWAPNPFTVSAVFTNGGSASGALLVDLDLALDLSTAPQLTSPSANLHVPSLGPGETASTSWQVQAIAPGDAHYRVTVLQSGQVLTQQDLVTRIPELVVGPVTNPPNAGPIHLEADGRFCPDAGIPCGNAFPGNVGGVPIPDPFEWQGIVPVAFVTGPTGATPALLTDHAARSFVYTAVDVEDPATGALNLYLAYDFLTRLLPFQPFQPADRPTVLFDVAGGRFAGRMVVTVLCGQGGVVVSGFDNGVPFFDRPGDQLGIDGACGNGKSPNPTGDPFFDTFTDTDLRTRGFNVPHAVIELEVPLTQIVGGDPNPGGGVYDPAPAFWSASAPDAAGDPILSQNMVAIDIMTGGSTVTPLPMEPNQPRCGNGIREGDEECDDGNLLNGDCCSSSCRIESAGTTTCGVGACQRTVPRCVGSVPQTCTPGPPSTEGPGGSPSCANGVDDDCDGLTDRDDPDCGRNVPPDCNGAVADPAEVWPPNHGLVAVAVAGVSDRDGDPVTVTITGITQNEPLAVAGSGHTCPDAAGVGTAMARVRAERAGQGDGRVYHLRFTADDGRGSRCSGVVIVCVPHDQGSGHRCSDAGPVVDSTGPCG